MKLNDVDNIYLGSQQVDKVYKGVTVIWAKSSGGKEIPLTIKATDYSTCSTPASYYSDEGVTTFSPGRDPQYITVVSAQFTEDTDVTVTITEPVGTRQYSWTIVGARDVLTARTGVSYNTAILGTKSWTSSGGTYTYTLHIPSGFYLWLAKFNNTGTSEVQYSAVTA